MAETVETRAERSLSEYEIMKAYGLMDKNEITNIIKQREKYDYLLAKQQKILKNYMEYIKYERNLIKILMERKKNADNSKLEHILIQKVCNLFIQATTRFPEVQRLWEDYYLFLYNFKLKESHMSAAIDKFLQFHSDKPDVWEKCIYLERNFNKNEEKCRSLLLRGLQKHPDSIKLYLVLLDVELSNSKDLSQSVVLEHATVIYNNAKKKVRSIDMLIKVLNKVTSFGFAKSLEVLILNDLKDLYFYDELFWNTIAERELKGNITFTQDGQISNESSNRSLKKRIQICVQVYKTALTEIQTEMMWNMYLNAMLELNMDMSEEVLLKRQVLGKAYKAADQSNRMTEKHYLQYLKILNATKAEDDVILKVMQKAIKLYPDNPSIWSIYMRFYIERDDANNSKSKIIQEIFNQAKKKLASQSYPLWELYLDYIKLKVEPFDEIFKLFEHIAKETSPNFNELKAKYIEYAAVTAGINYARKIYKRTLTNAIVCLEMHLKMAELESYQITPDVESWRKCLDLAVTYYGKDRTDLWLQYISFELKNGEPKNATIIAERASTELNPDLLDNFISERDLLQLGMVSI